MYELAHGLRVKYGFAKPPRTCAVANKAQISLSIDSFINTLTTYVQKEKISVLLGLFSEVFQMCVQRALMGSGGSKQVGTGLWIA